MRLPVALKLNTCRMTLIPSNTYTAANNMITSGFFKVKAIEQVRAPKNSDPVSPMNIFAGFILNIKKAIEEPIRNADNTAVSIDKAADT